MCYTSKAYYTLWFGYRPVNRWALATHLSTPDGKKSARGDYIYQVTRIGSFFLPCFCFKTRAECILSWPPLHTLPASPPTPTPLKNPITKNQNHTLSCLAIFRQWLCIKETWKSWWGETWKGDEEKDNVSCLILDVIVRNGSHGFMVNAVGWLTTVSPACGNAHWLTLFSACKEDSQDTRELNRRYTQ